MLPASEEIWADLAVAEDVNDVGANPPEKKK
jgi:hypothetical protein